ncbi:alpha/beta fold hydrolase, partial [bacterium]
MVTVEHAFANVPRALFPFDKHYFDRGGGVRMHYLDEGHGEPVVMVHGNPSWSFYYRDLARALTRPGPNGEAPKFRAIVPDHVGCGLSDKPSDALYDYTLDERIRDLEALLEHLGVRENITLVLH